jgi:hypothetical protein
MDAAIELLFQPLQARGLDLPDLVGEQAQQCPLGPQLANVRIPTKSPGQSEMISPGVTR